MRDRIGDPAPFNAGNSNICFVDNFCYLGCIIDKELTMIPHYKAVYRCVEQKYSCFLNLGIYLINI